MMVPRHFIFGYGSLICPLSRAITAPSLSGVPAQPALIHHMQRTWSARISRPKHHLEGWTAMGVRFRQGFKCSGVLIEVDEEELRQFDQREKGYDRKEIELEHIRRVPNFEFESDDDDHIVFRASEFARRGISLPSDDDNEEEELLAVDTLSSEGEKHDTQGGVPDSFIDTTLDVNDMDDVKVWVYVQKDATPADAKYPIKQSYVDIILRGCLSISETFARSFLDTTHGWWHDGDEHRLKSSYNEDGESADVGKTRTAGEKDENDDDHHTWIEDRKHGLYVRADPEYSKSMGHKLDELVNEHHPEALGRRKKFSVENVLPSVEKKVDEFD